MSETAKHTSFCREPMGSKPVSDIPGVGPALTKKLNEMGIYEARDIYEILRKDRFDESKFRSWMKRNCKGGRYQSCYNALLDWHNQFDKGNTNNAPERPQRDPRRLTNAITPRATKKNEVKNAKTSVQPGPTNTVGYRETEKSLLESDETALFFMSMQVAVKKFDPELGLAAKSEIYRIVSDYQRRDLALKRSEPVASTSTISTSHEPYETIV